ncbi:MAG: hypothetical protein ACFE9S_11065 [Candidatus Hermodarchaeota archaeon]
MIEEKILRYKNGIALAKELSRKKYADPAYYNELISKFERILKFYEDLKVWKEFSEQ